ncbi:MAG: hypothetical protein HYW26_02850 [Candidatus Aenigmarchaeota archaeon]|nr:hypothetical protein [Candidatus Aenigmarchaeota archaeon]
MKQKKNRLYFFRFDGKKSLALLLLIIFLALGCVQKQVKTDPNDGLKISEFVIDPDDVEGSDYFWISALVENVGGTTARNAEVQVYGISWKEEKVTLFSSKELRPPEPERNVEGGVAFGQRRIQAPQLPEGITHKFNFVARALYDYSTSAVTQIPVMSKTEFDRQKLRGSVLPALKITNTNAPIKIDMSGGSPIIAEEEDSGEFFFKIHLKNTGSGIPITNGVTGLITGTVSIEGGGRFKECLGVKDTSKIKLPVDSSGILLRRGESVTLPCSIELDTSRWEQIPQGALLIRFELTYRYFTENEGQLVVHGRRLRKGGETEPVPTAPSRVPSDVFQTSTQCYAQKGSCVSGECSIDEEQIGYCGNFNVVCCRALTEPVPAPTEPVPAKPTEPAEPTPSKPSYCDVLTFCGPRPADEKCNLDDQGGLYRSGASRPFGTFCNFDSKGDYFIGSMQSWFRCVSGCYDDIYIDKYDTPIRIKVPEFNECRPECK